MNKIFVSIIVPVYNVQNYLKRCIDSLLSQTLSDIEIILVDDGSTDGSEKICEEYAAKHKFIKVIHQKNAGLSVARNTGINNAKGEYVLFVDSDDYIELESCEKLYKIAKEYNCDIVKGNSWSISDTYKKQDPGTKQSLVPEIGIEFITQAIQQGCMCMCAQFALYRKSLIEDHHLYFYPGIYHEDELWTPQIYLKAKRVWSENYYFYYHWNRPSSITQTSWSKKREQDVITVCKNLYPLYNIQEIKYRKILLDYLCMLYLNAVNQFKDREADKVFPLKTAYSINNRLKAYLFYISPMIYFYINRLWSYIKIK